MDEAVHPVPVEVVVQYVVGAYMAVLTWWLDRGAKLPADRIEAMFRRLALDGIASSFSPQPQVNAVEGVQHPSRSR